ncbi:ATP synthase F0 subcomplex C subunit [Bacteroidales bacterium WCE2004]|nr:ATP synthase F0 subunit C [Bacteroidales bacterium]SKC63532.1 ATP synthase F0 subcomplex C subunit [Bacteroidales bacterium WCE2004]
MLGTILEAAALAKFGGALGAGIVALAAAIGIGKLAQSTMEASARQPEIAGGLRTTAIIIGALIEGVCLFGVLVCLLAITSK